MGHQCRPGWPKPPSFSDLRTSTCNAWSDEANSAWTPLPSQLLLQPPVAVERHLLVLEIAVQRQLIGEMAIEDGRAAFSHANEAALPQRQDRLAGNRAAQRNVLHPCHPRRARDLRDLAGEEVRETNRRARYGDPRRRICHSLIEGLAHHRIRILPVEVIAARRHARSAEVRTRAPFA